MSSLAQQLDALSWAKLFELPAPYELRFDLAGARVLWRIGKHPRREPVRGVAAFTHDEARMICAAAALAFEPLPLPIEGSGDWTLCDAIREADMRLLVERRLASPRLGLPSLVAAHRPDQAPRDVAPGRVFARLGLRVLSAEFTSPSNEAAQSEVAAKNAA